MLSRKYRPAPGSSPSQRAASTRRKWPLEKSSTSPSAARTRAHHPVGPRADFAGDSPPGQPSRNSCQSGRSAWMSALRAAFVRAVVPLDQVGLDLRHGAEAGQLAVRRARAGGS